MGSHIFTNPGKLAPNPGARAICATMLRDRYSRLKANRNAIYFFMEIEIDISFILAADPNLNIFHNQTQFSISILFFRVNFHLCQK